MIFMSPLELNEFYFSSKPLLRKLTSYVFLKERSKHYFLCSLKVLYESENKDKRMGFSY